MKIIRSTQTLISNNPLRSTAVVLVIIGVIGFIIKNQPAAEEVISNTAPVVTVSTPAKYSGSESLTLIGTVRAVAEANITSEQSGRVVSVPVKLGGSVKAGQVIATLENASERASVLQAEGVYEAAQAAAAQSGIGVDQANTAVITAKQNAVSTFQSSYNTVNGLVLNSVDTYFSDPNGRLPGLRIDGKGYTMQLNNERIAFQTLLPEWQNKANSINVNSDLPAELTYARENTKRTIAMIDTFLTVFSSQSNSARYTDVELQGFITTFTGLRSNLIGVQSSIDNAINGLTSAEDNVRRAELASSGGKNSAADAQVKQALGTLRAAQANLAKTILRSPISGTINNLSVRTGDFVNSFSTVAQVANNKALEVVTYVSEKERDLFAVGDKVMIEGNTEGIVTEIAPAVDPTTRKVEVRIATENIEVISGDTVRITKEGSTEAKINSTIIIPLSAVKFELEDGYIFTVTDNKLIAKPITLGKVRGGSIEVTAGLGNDDTFVVDARGLTVDTTVTINE